MKSMFKTRFVIISFLAILLTAYFLSNWAYINPVSWFTLVPSPHTPPEQICHAGQMDGFYGWPLAFVGIFTHECDAGILLNPISLMVDFGLFLLLVRVLLIKKTKIPEV